MDHLFFSIFPMCSNNKNMFIDERVQRTVINKGCISYCNYETFVYNSTYFSLTNAS